LDILGKLLTMLYEPDVSAIFVKYLENLGYKIRQELKPTERGVDIIAENDSEVLCIEVKGETSWLKTSKRFGKPFTSNQVVHHVARALYSSLKDFDKQAYGSKTKVAMAFPDTSEFRKRVTLISKSLKLFI
jgi:hypothetical protein